MIGKAIKNQVNGLNHLCPKKDLLLQLIINILQITLCTRRVLTYFQLPELLELFKLLKKRYKVNKNSVFKI